MSSFRQRATAALDDAELRTSLTLTTNRLRRWRDQSLESAPPFAELQARGAAIRRRDLDELPALLEQLEIKLGARGVSVVWAESAEAACRTIVALALAREAGTVLRSRSPLLDEIGLDAAMKVAAVPMINTNFGDFILQLSEDRPSHPNHPALHQTKENVAATFEAKLDMPQTLDAQAMGSMARFRLRRELLRCVMTVSGVALAAADTGELAMWSEAGEDRLGALLSDVHVAVMGLEQVTETLDELLFLAQLAAIGNDGQGLPHALTLINGPAQADAPDGPSELHLIIIDNGRSQLLAGQTRDALACIGCGACHNICPVYREVGGHAYGASRSGPIGAVISPLLPAPNPPASRLGRSAGGSSAIALKDSPYADLPAASTLCGACATVCPVGIDLPGMLVKLRAERPEQGMLSIGSRSLRAAYRWGMANPDNYVTLHGWLRRKNLHAAFPPLRAWEKSRDLPPAAQHTFRDRWKERQRS